jgi:hypothetical protein
MSKDSFFTPIDLPDPPVEDQTADPSVPNWPTPKLFGPVLDKIAVEIDRIANGTSQFTPHGIMLDRDKGFMNVWNKFKNAPTKEHMDRFLDFVEQDVNLRARREFAKWLKLVTKEVR